MERMRNMIRLLGHKTANFYMYLVGKSTHEPCVVKVAGENIQLWKNQLVFSLRNASCELGHTNRVLITMRNKLVELGLIKVVKKTHCSIITVGNAEGNAENVAQPTTPAMSYEMTKSETGNAVGNGVNSTGNAVGNGASEEKSQNGQRTGQRGGQQSYIYHGERDNPNPNSISALLESARKLKNGEGD